MKHADMENNSSSSNSPSLEHLNDSIEPSDEEENDANNDSDDSVDELGALMIRLKSLIFLYVFCLLCSCIIHVIMT